jgi:hypothetical protein
MSMVTTTKSPFRREGAEIVEGLAKVFPQMAHLGCSKCLI